MSKLLRFTSVSICIVAVCASLAFKPEPSKPNFVNPENYYFPVYLAGDLYESTTSYADAILRFEQTILERQRAIKSVFDSIPALSEMNKARPSAEDVPPFYQINWAMMLQFSEKNARFLDTLSSGYAFLGKDSEQSVLKARREHEAREKRKAEAGLPKATRDREALFAEAKENTDAKRAHITSALKEQIPVLVSQDKAFFINALSLPVFADTLLFSKYSTEDLNTRVAQYMFSVLSIRSAYPQVFAKFDEEYKRYVSQNDWFGLFQFVQAKANPLNEEEKLYLRKHKKVFGIGI